MPKREYIAEKKAPNHRSQGVVLTITRACNLRCQYCYESIEERGTAHMDYQTAKDVFSYYMDEANGYESVAFNFFGGEPMLNFPLIKELVEWYKYRTWHKQAKFIITTNGTILNDEMKDWLSKNRRIIGMAFSLDGNRTAHDLCRNNSFELLEANIPFFRECWPLQPASMTICRENIPYLAQSIIELEEKELIFTAKLVFEDIWGGGVEKKELLEVYENQLARLVKFYSENSELSPAAPVLTHAVEAYGRPFREVNDLDTECVRRCGAGHDMVMIDVDGSAYPCHRFAPWVTGKPAPKQPVNRQKEWGPDQCSSCKLLSICPTCAGFNWEINGDTGIRTTYHCKAFKIEFLASAKLHALRLGKDRKPKLEGLSRNEKEIEKARLDSIISLFNDGI